MHELELQEHMK